MIQKFNFYSINLILNIFLILLGCTAYLSIDENLTHFMDRYTTFFIILYLASLSLLFYQCIFYVFNVKNKKTIDENNKKAHNNRILNLGYDEKLILAKFIDNQKIEIGLAPKNPSVQILDKQKLIFNTCVIEGSKQVYRIDADSYQLLRSNPNLLY